MPDHNFTRAVALVIIVFVSLYGRGQCQQNTAPEYVSLPAYLRSVEEFSRAPSDALLVKFAVRGEVWRSEALREMRLALKRRDPVALSALPAAIVMHLETYLLPGESNPTRAFHLAAVLQLLSDGETAVPKHFQRLCHLTIIWSLQGALKVDQLVSRLQHAVDRYGSHPDLIVAKGSLFELIASRPDAELEQLRLPAVRVVNELTDRSGATNEDELVGISVDRPAIYAQCAQLYRRALTMDPTLDEARIRLAKVLLDAGRARGCLAVLDEPPSHIVGARCTYLTQLFRGRALTKLGEFEAASAAYRAASSMRPGCGTPIIALSYAQWLSGDIEVSTELLARFVEGDDADRCTDDPWLSYSAGQAWRIADAIKELRLGLRR